MGQVPTYTIIGAGRLARHFCFYFEALQVPFRQWSRRSTFALQAALAGGDVVLLLISDQAIEPFVLEHRALLGDKTVVHCSGSLVTELAVGVHPLMTFAHELYAVDLYQKIPFVVERGAPAFAELFPALPNPSFVIAREQKALYHSLCVAANNFTTLLWQKFFDEMQSRWDIPAASLQPFLRQTFANLELSYETALTGPLARNDVNTIRDNVAALEGDSFQKIYQACVEVFTNEYS